MPAARPLLFALLLAPGCLLAQVATPPPMTVEEAPAQRARAREMRDAAQRGFMADKAECNTRVLAVGCLTAARDRRAATVREADAIHKEAYRVEREAQQARLTEKEAQRAAGAPAEAARAEADSMRFREEQAQRAVERKQRQAVDQGGLDGRRATLAAKREAQLRKIEEGRREDARRAAAAPENARKRAERERQRAERVKKIDQRASDYAAILKQRAAEKAAADARAAAGQ